MEWKTGIIEDLTIIDLEKHEDSRGYLIETFRSDELPTSIIPAMSYVSITNPGQSRGPHEHVHQTDVFSFVGPGNFRFVAWDNRKKSPTYGIFQEHTFGEIKPATIIVPPGIIHGYINTSDKAATVINYPDRLYMGEKKVEDVDEIRHESDLNSPFKL